MTCTKNRLYHRWFFVYAEHFLHDLYDLTQCSVGMDSFHKIGHRIFSAFHRNSEFVQCLTNSSVIARLAEFLQTLHLSLISLRVHFENGDRQGFLFSVGIHADDLTNASIDFTLVTISRVRDLALEETLFNGRNDSA